MEPRCPLCNLVAVGIAIDGITYEMCFSLACDWAGTIPDARLVALTVNSDQRLQQAAERWAAVNTETKP